MLSIDLDIGDVVLEHCGNVHLVATNESVNGLLMVVWGVACGVPPDPLHINEDGRTHTSGNVPLENTINRQVCERERG